MATSRRWPGAQLLLGLCLSSVSKVTPTSLRPIQGKGVTGPGSPPVTATDRARIGTLDVPSLGLGTIKWNPRKPEEKERLACTYNAALAANLDFFDTAERYGASVPSLVNGALRSVGLRRRDSSSSFGGSGEALLGDFLRAADPARRPIIATKFTPVPWRRDAQSVVDACRSSVERLGVDSLDLLQIHMPDVIQPFRRFGRENVKDQIYWDGLAECYKLGLVRNVGVSNYGPTLLSRAQAHLASQGVPLASNQINYSLLYRRSGAQATVDACLEMGVTPLAYYPLAMGVLSGKWDRDNLPADRGLRPYFVGSARRGIPDAGTKPLLDALCRVGAARGCTPAQVALNWIMSKGAVPIAGATRPEHITSNLGALGWRLTPEEVADLELAADACAFEFEGSGFKTSDSKFVGYGFEKWTLD